MHVCLYAPSSHGGAAIIGYGFFGPLKNICEEHSFWQVGFLFLLTILIILAEIDASQLHCKGKVWL